MVKIQKKQKDMKAALYEDFNPTERQKEKLLELTSEVTDCFGN